MFVKSGCTGAENADGRAAMSGRKFEYRILIEVYDGIRNVGDRRKCYIVVLPRMHAVKASLKEFVKSVGSI